MGWQGACVVFCRLYLDSCQNKLQQDREMKNVWQGGKEGGRSPQGARDEEVHGLTYCLTEGSWETESPWEAKNKWDTYM